MDGNTFFPWKNKIVIRRGKKNRFFEFSPPTLALSFRTQNVFLYFKYTFSKRFFKFFLQIFTSTSFRTRNFLNFPTLHVFLYKKKRDDGLGNLKYKTKRERFWVWNDDTRKKFKKSFFFVFQVMPTDIYVRLNTKIRRYNFYDLVENTEK